MRAYIGVKLKWYKLLPVKQKIVGSNPITPAILAYLLMVRKLL